jgi:tetratricopeptide (TPR) repeat protein
LLVAHAPQARALECGDGWRRVDATASTLYTRSSERVARRLAGDLDSFQAYLAGLGPSGRFVSPIPLVVLALRGEREIEALLRPGTHTPQTRLGGMFLPGEDTNFVVLDSTLDAELGVGDVVYHELVHHYLRHNLPQAPRWLQEGMAEFFSTFQRRGDEVVVGQTIERHLRWLAANGLAPMAELLGARPIVGGETSRNGVIYAQSWLFVHYLLTGGEPTRLQLARFLEALRDHQPVVTAFSNAFEMSIGDMTPTLNRYLRGGRFGFYRIPAGEPDSTLSIAAASPAEACAQLGEMLSSLPPRASDARAYFERALELVPDQPLALAGLGRMTALQGQREEGLALLERAVAGEPEHHLPWYRYGVALLDRLPRTIAATLDGEQRTRLDAARDALGEAIRRRPDFGPAFAALGRSHLLDLATPTTGLAASTRAATLMPYRADVLDELAMLSAAAGAYARAFAVAEARLAEVGTAAQVRSAKERVTELVLRHAGDALARGDVDAPGEAMRVIDQRWAGELPAALEAGVASLRAGVAQAGTEGGAGTQARDEEPPL